MIKQSQHSIPVGKILVVVISVLGLSACATTVEQNELEPFLRSSDYNYFLSLLEDASLATLQLDEDGFDWPSIDSDADSAFLEFRLSETSGINPAIEVSQGAISYTQYFEETGSGIRYLDLTPLLKAGIQSGQRVALQEVGTSWSAEDVTLATFDNQIDLSKKTLVIAPHPDDAEIAAYGIYQSSQADVVTVTAGDAGGANFSAVWPTQGPQYRAKGRIRTLDSLTVPLLAGLRAEQIRNLGYYDATLSRLWQQRPSSVPAPLAELEDPAYFRKQNFDSELRERPFASNWPSLVNDLLHELETVQPDIVVAPHPFLDRHRDHQYAAIALFEALHRWDTEVQVLLYTNHAVGNEAFPLGPRDGMTGLPAWNEDNLYITGIYSHQLDTETQRQKLIALEAMHDLRPFDPRDGSEINPVNPLYDYFRRGPRPNEIFLVTNLLGARVIRGEFLRANAPPQLQLGM